MRALSLLLLAGLGLQAAEEPTVRIVRADPLVRQGLLYRCGAQAAALPGNGPWILTVSLVAGDQVLAVSEQPIATAAQLATGVVVALLPTAANAGAVPVLRVRVSDAQHRLVARAQRELDDRQQLATRGEAAFARVRDAGITDPLPWLLAQQAGDLLTSARIPTIADEQSLRRTVEALEAWRPGVHTVTAAGTHLLAYRDPVDTSVQPIRLTLPVAGKTTAEAPPLVLLLRPVAPGDVSWAPLPAAWSAAAQAAGVAVLDVRPAGDGTFTGAAARRLSLAVAAARAAAPGLGALVTVLAHDGLAQPAAWRQEKLPALNPPTAPLAAWADGPFVVVVGTGEHRAAADDAARLADAFIGAWRAHAGGEPPRIRDDAWRAGDWRGHHLVLIGSPRGNRVARELLGSLPLTWDDRVVRGAGQELHRSRLPAIALTLPRPDEPTSVVLLLDGSPAWHDTPGSLPFATAGDQRLILRSAPSE